jgi:hypothetical protein
MSGYYDGSGYTHRYGQLMASYGGALCQGVGAVPLDGFLSPQVPKALEPAAVDLSLEAAQHVERQRADTP